MNTFSGPVIRRNSRSISLKKYLFFVLGFIYYNELLHFRVRFEVSFRLSNIFFNQAKIIFTGYDDNFDYLLAKRF